MITGKTITQYNWFDIKDEICSKMQIDENYFGNYHTLVGGDYKNLWHVALDSVVPDNMNNDTIVTMYSIDTKSIEYFVNKHGEWTREFFKAYHDVMQELDPDDNGVKVLFSW